MIKEKILIIITGLFISSFAFSISNEGDVLEVTEEHRLLKLKEALEKTQVLRKNLQPKSIQEIHELLKELHAEGVPEIDQAFFFDEEFAYMNPTGLKIVEHSFKKKQAEAWIPCPIIYCNYENLIVHLFQKIKATKPISSNCDYMILNRYSPDFLDPHLTPVSIIYQENHTDIFFFDSRGILRDSFPIEELKRILKKQQPSKKFNFYFSSIRRQIDFFSCPLFLSIKINYFFFWRR